MGLDPPPCSSSGRSHNNFLDEVTGNGRSQLKGRRQPCLSSFHSSSPPNCYKNAMDCVGNVVSNENRSKSKSLHIPREMPQLPFSTHFKSIDPSGASARKSRLERRASIERRAVSTTAAQQDVVGRGSAPPRTRSSKSRRPAHMVQVDHQTDRRSFSSARMGSVASADMANNQKSYLLPPSEKGRSNRSTPSYQNKIDKMMNYRIHDISSHTCDTIGASTSSSNMVSASSQPSKHPSPICATRVPVIASTSSFTPARYSKPNAIRPPPPPRQSPKPLKCFSPPPRSKSNDNDSSHLAMKLLVNSKFALPLPPNNAAIGSSPGSHKIPGRHTLSNAPEEFKKSQLYPPPPKGRRPPRVAITSRATDHTPVLTRAHPEVKNNMTQSRRRSQENISDEENRKSNPTLLNNGKTNISFTAAAVATPGGKPQQASFLSKTRKQLSHVQGVIALANPSPNSQYSKLTQQANQQHLNFLRFRQDYTLGEAARSPSHMIIAMTSEKATEALSSLSIRDHVFIKRSGGRFTYAVLTSRSNEEDNNPNQSLEECMTFVLTDSGCTKLIKRSQWSEFVRLISTNNGCKDNSTLPITQDKARHDHGSYDRTNDQDVEIHHEVEDHPSPNAQHPKKQNSFLGFRQDYTLGEAARSPSHMIIEGNSEKAMKAVNSLSIHDFAFVKRSDGLFHYAILAFRSNEQGDSTSNQSLEECMTFVLSDLGCTKMIKKSQWSEFVRLSSTNNGCNKDPTLPTVTANTLPMQQDKARQHAHGSHDRNNDQDVKSNHEVEDYLNKLRTEFYSTRGPATVGLPPSTISFDMAEDDMISCVSEPGDFLNERLEMKYTPSQPVILE